MASPKIVFSTAEQMRNIDELQRRAEQFLQFSKNAQRELLTSGQKFASMVQDFNKILTGAGPASSALAAPAPPPPQAGPRAELVQEVEAARVRERNARNNAAGRAEPLPGHVERENQASRLILLDSLRGNAAAPSEQAQNELPEHAERKPRMSTKTLIDGLRNSSASHPNMSDAELSDMFGIDIAPPVSMPDFDLPDLKGMPNDKHARLRAAGMLSNDEWGHNPIKKRPDALATPSPEGLPQFDLPGLNKYGLDERHVGLLGKEQLTEKERRQAMGLAATGRASHLQYDVTDIPSAMGMASQFQSERAGLEKRVQGLRAAAGPGTEANQVVATALDNVVRKMDVSNRTFSDAVSNFQKMSATPGVTQDSKEYRVALDELRHSIEDLTHTNQELDRTTKASKELPGGGGGGQGGSGARTTYERLRPYMQVAGAIGGAVMGTTAAVLHAGTAMEQASLGAERRGQEGRGSVGTEIARQTAEAHNMTDPFNLLKYRADLLFGRQYKYAGVAPRRLEAASLEEATDAMGISRRQLLTGTLSAIGGTASGAMQTVGGAAMLGGGALAAGVGAQGISSGIQGMTSSIGGGIDNAASNRYLQLEQGGLEGSIFGRMWRGTKEAARRAGLLQDAVQAEMAGEHLSRLESLRTNEVKEFHSEDLVGLEERQRMIDVQKQGAVLVGKYAAKRGDVLDALWGPAQQTAEMGLRNKLQDNPDAFKDARRRQFIETQKALGSMRHIEEEVQDTDHRTYMELQGSIDKRYRKADAYDAYKDAKKAYANREVGFMDIGQLVIGSWYDKAKVARKLTTSDGEYQAEIESTKRRLDAVAPEYEAGQQRLARLQHQNALFKRAASGDLTVREVAGPTTTGMPLLAEGTVDAHRPTPARKPSIAAELELSPSEFQSKMDLVTNVLGSRERRFDEKVVGNTVGIQATAEETARMVRLGRSGLGDFSSLVGNVSAIGRATGEQNNLPALERVMAAAVAAGFDKSRTAQMFISTTADIARQLNITNVGQIAGTLSQTANLMSPTGIATERSFAQAAQGMVGFAQYTAQQTGIVGTLKVLQAHQAGLTVGTGAATAVSMSTPQRASVIADLDKADAYQKTLSADLEKDIDVEQYKRDVSANESANGLTGKDVGKEFINEEGDIEVTKPGAYNTISWSPDQKDWVEKDGKKYPKVIARGKYQFVGQTARHYAEKIGVDFDDTLGDSEEAQKNQEDMMTAMLKDEETQARAMMNDPALKRAGRIGKFGKKTVMYAIHGRGEKGAREYFLTGEDQFAGKQGNPHIQDLLIKSQKNWYGAAPVLSEEANDMLLMNQGNAGRARKGLEAVDKGATAFLEARYNDVVKQGKAQPQKALYNRAIEAMKKGDKDEATRLLQTGAAVAADIGAAGGEGLPSGAEGRAIGKTWFLGQGLSAIRRAGFTEDQVGVLQDRVAGGVAASRDEAAINWRARAEVIGASLRERTTGVTANEAADLYSQSEGRRGVVVGSGSAAGQLISRDLIEKSKSDQGLAGDIDKSLKSADRFELYRAAQVESLKSGGGEVQKVEIVGAAQLAQQIGREVGKNVGSKSGGTAPRPGEGLNDGVPAPEED